MKVWAKTEEFSEGKFLVVRRDGSIPHWPHFVLGARDPATPDALRAYADICQRLGYEPEYVASLRELADDFNSYRLLHGEGDPEAPPHRVDDPNVIDAMRGNHQSTIIVTRDKRNVPK
ncbi:hypothetical protein [Tardiphaga sp. 839_C3_N1_4]|uniref:hypothetical protein n=1 Tax=Tardiphaga sp. 839_C3_N1_4 TaxID=3240761 RepID=UPI003F28F03E